MAMTSWSYTRLCQGWRPRSTTEVRVRFVGDGGDWRSAFAWETASKTVAGNSVAYFGRVTRPVAKRMGAVGWTGASTNRRAPGAARPRPSLTQGVPSDCSRNFAFENLTLAGKPVQNSALFKLNEFVDGLSFESDAVPRP